MGRPNIIISNDSIRTGKITDDAGDIIIDVCTLGVTVDVTAETSVGANDGTASATPTDGQGSLTFAWTGPNGFTSTSQNIIGLEPGLYTVIVTDAILTPPLCTATANGTVEEAVGELFAALFNQLNFLSSTANEFEKTGDFFFSAWVYINVDANGAIVRKWNPAGNQRGYFLQFQASNNRIRFLASSDGIASTEVESSITLSLATWYHVVAYHDDGNEIGISVNNEAIVSTAFTGSIFDSSEQFVCGQALGARIDSLAMYDSVPSQSDIGILCNSGNGQTYTDTSKTNLGTFHKMNELTGPRIDFHGTSDLTDNSSVGRGEGKISD